MPSGNQVLVGLVVIAVVVWAFHSRRPPAPGKGNERPDWVEYQGQSFKLTKYYPSYDDYKNDDDNLDPSENARVEEAVINAKVAKKYSGPRNLIIAMGNLKFPGYGMSVFGEKPRADGSVLAGYAIEIPRTPKYRVLVFRGRGGSYTLLDDFINESGQKVVRVREEGGQLVYSTLDDEPVLSRPLGDR